MRGSNADASVFWLARLLESGDDPSFIARRMIIFASEDIGIADPQALVVAVAASQALHAVGLPEAQLNLAQSAVYLALAPKSNHVAQAIWTAREDVRNGADVEVPAHLRDSHYSGAGELGHGVGYQSPHNQAASTNGVEQDYLPAQTEGRAVRRSPYFRG
jgi:putative ATPase